jgi:hypothetical protein
VVYLTAILNCMREFKTCPFVFNLLIRSAGICSNGSFRPWCNNGLMDSVPTGTIIASVPRRRKSFLLVTFPHYWLRTHQAGVDWTAASQFLDMLWIDFGNLSLKTLDPERTT